MGGAFFKWVYVGVLAAMASACVPDGGLTGEEAGKERVALKPLFAPAPETIPVPPKPILIGDVLNYGVVIVVSKASQQMHVFRNGNLWKTSPVSTGKRGKETPSGVFAILQKKEFHRSNLYSNAPMPFMQRLTWDGIAIHAGAIPGYPASHGCIRVPGEFAEELFQITGYASTGVIIADEALPTQYDALALARRTQAQIPIHPSMLPPRRIAKATFEPAPAPVQGPTRAKPKPETKLANKGADQTIQLAALRSESQATAHWKQLARSRPELAEASMAIVAAMVDSQQYFRLRASAPNAHAMCADLNRAGISCFPVT